MHLRKLLLSLLVVFASLVAFIPTPATAADAAVERVTVGAYSGLAATATPIDPSTKHVGDALAVWVEAVNATQLQGVDFYLEYSKDTLEVDRTTDAFGNEVNLIALGDIKDVAADPGTLDAVAGTISVGVANQAAADYARAVLLKVQFKVKAEGSSYVRIRTGSLQLTGPGGACITPGSVEDLAFTIGAPPAPRLAQLSLSGTPPADFKVGDTFDLSTLTLTGTDENGQPYDLTGKTVTWASSNTAVATVSGHILTAVSAGTTEVTATVEGVTSNALTFTITPSPAPGEVWVDDDWAGLAPDTIVDGHIFGVDAFATIQEGIDAAASPGTVHVAPGTYHENIILKDGVKVLGAGADVTVIDGGQKESVVEAIGVGPETRLDGFTVTNGGIGIECDTNAKPTIINCVIRGNTRAGGIVIDMASATIINCIISGNSTTGDGGGIFIGSDSVTVVNTVISGNHAGYCGGGIAMYTTTGTVDIINSTIVGNDCGISGGGIFSMTYIPLLMVNSIVRDNRAGVTGPELSLAGGGSVTYSNIKGGYPGTGNIDADPLFVEPAAGDYHLQPGSPCIDAGDNASAPAQDLDGNPRPIDGNGDGIPVADMGAYEFMPTEAIPQELRFEPPSYALKVGETAQAAVKALYPDGREVDVTNEASYASADEKVATVSASGLITAVGEGETMITATYGGKSAQAKVTVQPATEEILVINAPDECIPVGQEFKVTVEVKNVKNMYGADVRLGFDPYFLEAVDVKINTDGVFSLGGTTTIDNTNGYVAFNASRNYDDYGYEGYYGDAVLAWITFKANQPNHEGTCINFLSAELVGNEDGEGSPVYNIPVNNWINDCVCISGYVLGGRVIPEAMPLRQSPYYMDYSGTKVYLEGTSLVTYTDAEGNYSFINPPPGVYNVVAEREGYLAGAVEGVSVDGVNGANVNLLLLTGDITRDNAVDIDDLNVMRTDYDTWRNIRSDLDYSGWVGIRDLVYLARNYTKYGYGYLLP